MPSHKPKTRMNQPHRVERRQASAAARHDSVAQLVALATSGDKGSQGAMSECVARGITVPARTKPETKKKGKR